MIKRLTLGLLLVGLIVSPIPAADTAKIDEAVKKGVDFLRGFHGSGINPGQHGAGSVALCGMALMAGGMKDSDPTISAIANYLRPQVFTNTKTYDVALMTLFFDKLGKPTDEGLIQLLGVKLISGQNGGGGWGYDTWTAGELDAPKWVNAFRNWKADGRMHPEVARLFGATRHAGRGGPAGAMALHGDDNSNTQFALIAMWVAGRHAVPIRESAALIDMRFMRTQDPQTGGWGYSGFGGSTPSMTCAGLLGLAVGFGSRDARLESEGRPEKPKKEEDDDPFSKPPAPGQSGDAKPEDQKQLEDPFMNRRKAAIDRGMAGLGRILGGNAAGARGDVGGYGGSGDLYFYWSVERVGVAYGIEKIGGVDWYEWGAPSLLASQAADGSWGGSYGAEVNTSFGILFLTRANFAVDLSAKLKNKFGSELRGGGIPIMKAIPFAEQTIPKAKPGEPPPKISGIREISQADKLADALVGIADKDFADKLKEYQTAKGEQYTVAIAFALNQLEKDNKKKAREALVARLVRMTPETLRKFIAVNNPELRRATCIACAMKDDKSHISDLVSRVVDTDEEVIKAARAGLRSLTGEDYGPTPGASEDEKQAVLSKWRFWVTSRSK